MKSGEAWIDFQSGKEQVALQLMQLAAMEDSTEKHPVTPGEVCLQESCLAICILN